jgi:hypothetical protein
MHSIFENIMIMILTILILVGGAYLVLLMLEWGLKIKSGNREQEGLTSMWASTYKSINLWPEPSEGYSNDFR